MDNNRKNEATDLLRERLIVVILYLFGGLLISIGCSFPNPGLLSTILKGVGSSLIVGLIVESLIKKAVTKRTINVLETLGSLKGILDAGIKGVYVNRKDAREKIEKCLSDVPNNGIVRFSGIALRDFLYKAKYPELNQAFFKAIKEDKVKEVQLLLMNPWCKNAFYRAESEHPDYKIAQPSPREWVFNNSQIYKQRSVYVEVDKAYLEFTDSLRTKFEVAHRKKIQIKFYDTAEACYLVFVGNSLFTEQYYYSNRKENLTKDLWGIVPMFEYDKESDAYKQLQGHFEYVWSRAMPEKDWLELSKDNKNLDHLMENCRPGHSACLLSKVAVGVMPG
jgi:hypothetical protein